MLRKSSMLKRTSPTAYVQLVAYGALLTAGVAAALGFGIRGLWVEMVVALGFTAMAIYAEHSSWSERLAGPSLAGFAVLGGGGLLRGLPTLLGLITVAAALISWDLHYFRQRLAKVDHIEAEGALVKEHLQRLFVVVGLGVAAGGLALLIRVSYGAGILFLLGLILVFGLSRAVSYLRKESD
jgi:hypothetical protein